MTTLEFTPLEFETNHDIAIKAFGIVLEFTPLEFETISKKEIKQ